MEGREVAVREVLGRPSGLSVRLVCACGISTQASSSLGVGLRASSLPPVANT